MNKPLGDAGKMKVLLIYPPDETAESKYVFDIFQPLGLAYIAAILEEAEYEVRIIDACTESLSRDQILRRVLSFNPQIVGLSGTTFDFGFMKQLAKEIKSQGDYTVVVGGPHVSALPEEAMQEKCFDYGVIGEGERTVVELIDAISEGSKKKIANVRGIIFYNGSKIVRTPPRAYIEDLDTLPFPARHLLPPITKYRYTSYKYLPTATIVTTRGCPYQCTFCDQGVFGNKFRTRSVTNIVDEIETLVEQYGVRGINILDDLFTLTSDRVIAFCHELISRKLKIAWTCLNRADRVNIEMLKIMKKAGCWQICYGIESGNQMVLNTVNKDETLETIAKAVQLTHESKINVWGLFMIGLPGETEASIRDTIQFAKRLPFDRAQLFITQPFPGSELYKTALAEGKIARDVEYHYYHNFRFPEKLAYIPDGLSLEIIKKSRKEFYRAVYLQPSRLVKIIIDYRRYKRVSFRLIAFLKGLF